MKGKKGIKNIIPAVMTESKLLKPQSAKLEALVQHHASFLRFLLSRVSDSSIAEDILHSAYLKALEHENQLHADDSVVAWFYRILRNSVIDYYRRNAARSSAHDRYASERPISYETELHQQVCACVKDVIEDLKPEYREAIEVVDLAEKSIEQFAKAKRITSNNASVRLHRARKALAGKLTEVCGVCAEHKCVDCTCRRNQL
ncbi:MAG TPA: sigma-70 family RNA polymerase sigma factor [Terriglobales bacterium]|nr:sigma-70 family RNA polymerase sigma factor [Terriglobales bacterium]